MIFKNENEAIKTSLRMNLQLFANPEADVQTTLLNTPGNDLSPAMREYWDKSLLDFATPKLVHNQFGQKKPIPSGNGKTINFVIPSRLPKATTPLVEGVTPSGGKLDLKKLSAEVRQYGYYIEGSDVLSLTAAIPVMEVKSKLLGRQAGVTLDTITRNALHTGTNVQYCAKVSGNSETAVKDRGELDESCKLTVKEIMKAATTLKAADIDTVGDSYIAFIHPHISFDIKRDHEFIEWSKYTTPEKMYEGEIGKIDNVRFIETTEAKINYGEDLASNSRKLLVNGAVNANATTNITFDGGTVAKDALIGRWINISGKRYKVTANTANTITVDGSLIAGGKLPAIADNSEIWPGEGGKGGVPVYGTVIFGDDSYGVTEVEGGGLEMIVKPLGSSGVSDPLNQRSSMGWKALHTAEILMDEAIVRVESCSTMGYSVKTAN